MTDIGRITQLTTHVPANSIPQLAGAHVAHDPPRVWTEFELRILIDILTRDMKNEIAMLHAKVRHLENDG